MNDVVNETEAEEVETEQPEAPKKKRGGGAGVFTATLVALIAVGGVIYLYQQQLFLKRDVQALQQGLDKMLSVVEQNHNDVLERLKTVPEHTHPQLVSRLQQVEQLLSDTRMRIGQDRHTWALAEAEYLVRLADHDLRFRHSTVTAIAALQTAKARLEAEDRQGFSNPIRHLDSDINALSLVQLPDREALAQELAGLDGKIDDLPLLRQNRPTAPQTGTTEDAATEKRSGWDKIWFDLGNLITIRHEEEVVAKPMLPPEQRYFLRRNLQLKLESARLALLLDNSNAWRANLNEATEWTRRYFDGNDALVKELLATLEHLAEVKLLPPLPDLSTTRDLLQKLSRQAATTAIQAPPNEAKPKADTAKPAAVKPSKSKPAPKPATAKPAPVKKEPEPAKPVEEKATAPEPQTTDIPTTPTTTETKEGSQ
jgi:uroporphyrin-III C-methyltransferase